MKRIPPAQRQRRLLNAAANPVLRSIMRSQDLATIGQIKLDANIHAIMGANPTAAVHASASIMFIALGAAMQAGYTGDEPDLRILRGAASAAGDVTALPASLEHNRQAIISGLQAVDRIWPSLSPTALVNEFRRLHQFLASPRGLNLSDFEAKAA